MTAHLIKKSRRTQNIQYDAIIFPDGIEEIHLYGYNVYESEKRKRRYLIELHISHGFALIKFYPKCLKKHKRKYELRGLKEIGFTLSKANIIKVIYECAKVMRDYLDQNPDCFVGYVGQTDSRDNKPNRRRTVSQRSSIYNLLTNTIFQYPKYKLSSGRIFKEVNLRLIRKVRSRQEGKINKVQMQNYQSFLHFFENNKIHHLSMMTEETRKRYLN